MPVPYFPISPIVEDFWIVANRFENESTDSEKSHRGFQAKYELPFSLVSDVDKKVVTAFGVWGPKKFMGKEYDGIHRTTFVIDEEGKIEDVITKVKTKDHSAQIL